MKHRKTAAEPGTSLDLVEDATHLLRRTPISAWVAYYSGTMPFVLALLYFWSDMTRSAYARESLAAQSLLLALLFIWMKSWQCVAATSMLAVLRDAPPPRWTFGRVARMVLAQGTLQPLGMVARPVALLLAAPYAWTHAFFQNVTVLGNGDPSRSVFADAKQAATLWPRQNHAGLALIFLFAAFVWVNAAIAIIMFPSLLKTFLGIETAFTRSTWSMFNTTLLAAAFAATYLCVDPLLKAFYTLRCFHGASRHSGQDLRIRLNRLRVVGAMLLLFLPLPAMADAMVNPRALEREIEQVLEKPEFAWRMPRDRPPLEQRGWLGPFLKDAIEMVEKWASPAKEWVRKIFDWLDRWKKPQVDAPDASTAWIGMVETLVYVLSAALVLVGTLLIWRRWRAGRDSAESVARAVDAMPDLMTEDVSADQLPEDEWLRLAREMMERGELRLALRALYLAGLAHLGGQQLLTIARHKSSREYQRELERRARAREGLLTAFGENVATFERVWYGRHTVSEETLRRFRANFDRICMT